MKNHPFVLDFIMDEDHSVSPENLGTLNDSLFGAGDGGRTEPRSLEALSFFLAWLHTWSASYPMAETLLDQVLARLQSAGLELSGGDTNDFLFGSDGADRLHGGGGSNLLIGGAGDDILDVRWLTYGAKADAGVSFEAWRAEKRLSVDVLFGGAGNDQLEGSFGTDYQYGGTGDDKLRGQDGDDRLFGGSGNDRLRGDNGDDILFGGSGRDELYGNRGSDRLTGNDGQDRLYGGSGDDWLDGGGDRDVIRAGFGQDSIYAGKGNDWVDPGHGDDIVYLGDGNDFVAAIDQLGRGDDLIYGDGGDDWIHGGRQDDRIDGGAGNDRLNGGAGEDLLIGGIGQDVFEFRGNYGFDTIQDFTFEDELHFSQNINGLGIETAEDLFDRMFYASAGTYLDLGQDNGILFIGIAQVDLAAALETQFSLLA